MRFAIFWEDKHYKYDDMGDQMLRMERGQIVQGKYVGRIWKKGFTTAVFAAVVLLLPAPLKQSQPSSTYVRTCFGSPVVRVHRGYKMGPASENKTTRYFDKF